MKIEAVFEMKSNPTTWSDQEINYMLEDEIKIDIEMKKADCKLNIEGNKELKEIFYAIWELLAWNDGYFYSLIDYKVNGIQQNIEDVIRLPYYITDEKWIKSALLIGRGNRDISEKTITKYMNIRKMGRKQKSMNSSMIASYFFLHSEAYKAVNIEHRLVLLMHICDGIAIEFLDGDKSNNVGNINIVLEQLDTGIKYKTGAKMLGVSSNKAKKALGYTRNELTHYVFNPSSLGAFISDPDKETDNMVNLYAFYVLDLALRVAFLEIIGVSVDDTIKQYLLDENLDWIRLEKHLEEDCVIPQNMFRQMLERFLKKSGTIKRSVNL